MKLDEALALIDSRTTALADEAVTQTVRLTTLIDSLRSNGIELSEQQTNEVNEIVSRFGAIATELQGIGSDPKNPVPDATETEVGE